MAVKLEGLDQVLNNLSREVKGIEGRTRKSMQKVGLLVKGEAQEMTPHEHGALLGSAFFSTDMGARGSGPRVRIGYTAKYAPFVHEMPASNNFTKEGTGPKFLEKAVKNDIPKILSIIQKSAEVK